MEEKTNSTRKCKKRKVNTCYNLKLPAHLLCQIINDSMGKDINNLISHYISGRSRMGTIMECDIDPKLFSSSMIKIYYNFLKKLHWNSMYRLKDFYLFPESQPFWEFTLYKSTVSITIRLNIKIGVNDKILKKYYKLNQKIKNKIYSMNLYQRNKPDGLLFGEYEYFIYDPYNEWINGYIDIQILHWSFPGIKGEIGISKMEMNKFKLIEGCHSIYYAAFYRELIYRGKNKVGHILKSGVSVSNKICFSSKPPPIPKKTKDGKIKIEEIDPIKKIFKKKHIPKKVWRYDLYDPFGEIEARKFEKEFKKKQYGFREHYVMIDKIPQKTVQIKTDEKITKDEKIVIIQFIHYDIYRYGHKSYWTKGYYAQCKNFDFTTQILENAQSNIWNLYEPQKVIWMNGECVDGNELQEQFDQYQNLWEGEVMIFINYFQQNPSFEEFEYFIKLNFHNEFECGLLDIK